MCANFQKKRTTLTFSAQICPKLNFGIGIAKISVWIWNLHLRHTMLKCEVAGIGSLKRVKIAVCGIKCIDLTTETIKILRVHFTYNQKLKTQKISGKASLICRMF